MAVALGAVLVSASVPLVGSARDRARLDAAARHVALVFRTARLEAVRRGTAVAVEFSGDARRPLARLVADGNGNGVRRADIAEDIDRPLGSAVSFGVHHPGVTFTVGCACPRIDDDDVPPQGSPGLRFGTAGLVVFTPDGTGTPGTAYLSATATSGLTYAVRLNGVSGRARVLVYEPGARAWVPR